MDVAATIGAACSALMLILGFFFKVVKDGQAEREKLRRELKREQAELVDKLEQCTDEHAASQLEVGGLRESVRILSSDRHSANIRRLVNEQLEASKQGADQLRTKRANSQPPIADRPGEQASDELDKD